MNGRLIPAALGLVLLAAGAAAAQPQTAVTVRFDLFSPPGTRCQMGGAAPSSASDPFGRPYLRGLPVDRAVFCTAADGRSFGLNTVRDPRDPLALTVDVIVADRPGAAVPMMMVQADSQIMPLPVRGDITALPPAAK